MDAIRHEFAGFLMGEGCFRIQRRTSRARKLGWKTSTLYVPIIQVSLRADDGDMLKWAHKTYGGTLLLRQGRPQIPNQKPIYMWLVTSSSICLTILNDFLQTSLPSKKKKEAELLRSICQMKVNKIGHKGLRHNWYTKEELKIQDDAYLKLKEFKVYV